MLCLAVLAAVGGVVLGCVAVGGVVFGGVGCGQVGGVALSHALVLLLA